MTDKQLKIQKMFDYLAPRLLPEDETTGAIYKVQQIFKNIGATRLEKLVKDGIISPIPGTNQYFYASVLWDLLAHEEMPAELPKPKPTEKRLNGHNVDKISNEADYLLAQRLNGKH